MYKIQTDAVGTGQDDDLQGLNLENSVGGRRNLTQIQFLG